MSLASCGITHWRRCDFHQQLVILRHQLPLVALEGENGAADEESVLDKFPVAPRRHLQAFFIDRKR